MLSISKIDSLNHGLDYYTKDNKTKDYTIVNLVVV